MMTGKNLSDDAKCGGFREMETIILCCSYTLKYKFVQLL